jgi:hypothetical protein
MTEAQFELLLAATREEYHYASMMLWGGCGVFPTLCTLFWSSSPVRR